MKAKHSTTEGRHDGIGIPSATRPFAVANKNKQNKKTEPMKIIKNLTFTALAALAVTLLFQTPITRAGDSGQAAVPKDPFVILLKGIYQPVVAPNRGLSLVDLSDGSFSTV